MREFNVLTLNSYFNLSLGVCSISQFRAVRNSESSFASREIEDYEIAKLRICLLMLKCDKIAHLLNMLKYYIHVLIKFAIYLSNESWYYVILSKERFENIIEKNLEFLLQSTNSISPLKSFDTFNKTLKKYFWGQW